jgi:hypothetical protein
MSAAGGQTVVETVCTRAQKHELELGIQMATAHHEGRLVNAGEAVVAPW